MMDSLSDVYRAGVEISLVMRAKLSFQCAWLPNDPGFQRSD